MKFRVDVTRVVPLLSRKGVDSSTCWYYTRVFLNLGPLPSLPARFANIQMAPLMARPFSILSKRHDRKRLEVENYD